MADLDNEAKITLDQTEKETRETPTEPTGDESQGNVEQSSEAGGVSPPAESKSNEVVDSSESAKEQESIKDAESERKSRPGSVSDTSAETRPRSSSSKERNSKAKGKKAVQDANVHRVTFTVTIAKAIPTVEDEDQPDLKEMAKKKRRIVEAPRAQNYFHCEYELLPDEVDPVKTDVVTFGMAAKIYTERQEPKVLKTWHEGDLTWIAWTHSHTVTITEQALLSMFNHTLMLKVWDTKDKVSTRARFDRPKAFRLPQAKPGEDIDNIGGVKSLVMKQSRSFEKLQPAKRSYIDRPLPSQPRVVLATDSLHLNRKGKSKSDKDKKGDINKGVKNGIPDKLDDYLTKAGHSSGTPGAGSTTPGMPKLPTETGEALRSYSRLGRLAGVEIGDRERSTPKSAATTAGGAHSRSKSQPPPSGSRKDNQSAAGRAGTASTGVGTAPGSPTKADSTSASRGKDRSRRSNYSQAAAEHIRKFGVCQVSIPLAQLFSGVSNITERLSQPMSGIEDIFFSVALNGPLMSEELRKTLNPLIIKVHSATNMPSTPIPYADLKLRCLPAYTQYSVFNQATHKSVGRGQDQNIYWDDVNVVLAGHLEPSELRECLQGGPLEIEVHDRDRVVEKHKLKPTLFGDDLEDEKINNVGTVASKRTVHNPFSGRDKPWDPYGIAKFDLSELLLGQTILYLKSPIQVCPIPDVLGVRDGRQDGKLLGIAGAVDGPVESPLAAGHYMPTNAALKIKVELAYPLVTPEQVASKPDLQTTYECPFGRMVFKFDYKNITFLHKLQGLITEVNAKALELKDMPDNVIEAALSTYKLSLDQQQSRSLDIITGFQVMDGKMHLFVLEGLRSRAIQNIWDSLPKPERTDVDVLYNSDLCFRERLYGPLDVDLCRIKLHEPLSVIVQQPLLYVRDMVPKPCFEALVKLEELCKISKLRDAVRNDIFPMADMVVSMSREFGVPLTTEDFEELQPEQPERVQTAPIIPYDLPRTSRMWTPIDNENESWLQKMDVRAKSGPSHDYVSENQDAVHRQSNINKMERSKTMPVKVRADVTVPHNYSTQSLNSTELAKEKVRQILKSDPDRRFTYCPDYHHSMTVVPVDVEAIRKQEAAAAKAAWKTPKGWVFPGKKTMIESNVHPKKLDPARAEEIYTKWQENTLHKNKLEPTLARDIYPWGHRTEDMDTWTRPESVFGNDEPITIHMAGQKLKAEKVAVQQADMHDWKSKVVVDDIRSYFHRCDVGTEQQIKGPKSGNQLDRLQGMLKDPPKKLALRKPGMAVPEIPPLNVVLNPGVDTQAREAGIIPHPATPSSAKTPIKGFAPGPHRELSWAVEKNKIPVRDYEHSRFSDLNGQDFNVYHKQKSSLHKRHITPLTDKEYETHLFRIPSNLREFHALSRETTIPYILPNVEGLKSRAHTELTLDSGIGSFISMKTPTKLKAVETN